MNQEVEDLRETLETLEIKKEALRKGIQETKARLERLKRTERVEREEIFQGSGLYLGDTVEINIPSKG